MAGETKDLEALQALLNYRFMDPKLLTCALRTPAAKTAAGELDNSRLAFLGDAVIALAVKEQCHADESFADKGDLSTFANGLVSDENLARIAKERGLRSWLDVVNEPKENAGKETMLAQAVEAIVGAVYLDSGLHSFKVARRLLGLADEANPRKA